MVKKTADITVASVLKRIDIFGKPLPGFNVKGSDVVNTIVGGFTTIIIAGIVLIYATTKLFHLHSKANPNVSSFVRQGSYEQEDYLNLNEMNF